MSIDMSDAPIQRTGPQTPLWSRKLPARDLVSITLAGGGALLVFLSFVLDWVAIGNPRTNQVEITAGVDSVQIWGTTYVLGAMFLVALFVAVMVLPPAFGRSARVLGIGWAFGVGGVLAALVVRIGEARQGSLMWVMAAVSPNEPQPTYQWRAGLYCAIGALVLMIAAFATAWPPLRDIDSEREPVGR